MIDFENIEDSIRKMFLNDYLISDNCYYFIKDIIEFNRYDCVEIYYHIAKDYGINKIDELLFRAVEMKNIIIVNKLIDLGVDINTPKTYPGRAILYTCELYQFEEMLDLLLKNGADLNINPNNIFHTACLTNIEVLQLLFDHGLKINESDPTVLNSICTLIKNRSYEKLNLLIKNGININNVINQLGNFPFSKDKDKKTVDLLLSLDIDYITIIKLFCGINLKN
ncbi:ankyrin repeat protein [Acanthamoeba polyphaga moumouvirus]|uniref:Ankyrin repeat protein n=1 Tax=Acanthamoeba polyphaga moumouvirus TaxID=1269028 RepID=L7RDR3_9VIRU|nr:ankyrin repeat protein [Acanthamoeba polyphaga moumouvirus]AGC02228.1 ankyrin repeat protein [Acanthamoeba polyphaga moumouvirus]